MKILVGQHELKIDKKDKVNQNEYKVTKCEFEFDEAITNDLVKVALFTNSAGTYKQYIVNNECDIPAEILEKQETTTLGVYAYKEENEELELRYSPEEIKFYVSNGSYKEDAENTEPITPTDKEQMEQALQNGLNDINNKIDEVDEKLDGIETAIEETNNLNLDVSDKVDGDVTVTLTKKDASTKTVVLSDGTSLEFNWDGTKLGIKTSDEEEYTYVDLQGIQGPVGPQGEAFRIKKTYSSVAEMNADFNNMEYGDYVMIASSVEVEDNAKLYTRGESQWIFITDFSGATGIRGPVGATPNIQIGSVTSGSTPSVTRTGTDENPVLNFVLQKGDKGDKGNTGLTGNGISSITKTSTSGLVDTYTITYTNGNTTTFNVSNGNGIDRIEKTATVGNKDTYTIYFTNGSTTTYEVSNGEVTREELEEEVERLSMIYNAFPSTTGEGEEPSINGTAEVPFKEIGLKGNTSQESTTGKNLYYIEDYTTIVNQVTITYKKDGTITLNGTASANSAPSLALPTPITLNGYYTLSINVQSGTIENSNIAVTINDENRNILVSRNQTGASTTSNLSNKQFAYAGLYLPSGVKLTNYIIKPQFETGQSATDYEPYTGGNPAPNPDYPYPVNVVTGDNEVKVEGKNLFDKNGTLTTGFLEETGTVHTAGDGANWKISDYIPIQPNTNYTTSGVATIGFSPSRCYYDENKNFISGVKHNGVNPFTNTSPANAYFMRESIKSNELNIAQLEKGSTATTYEPYQSQTYPINLGSMELCKIGDYQDYLYKENGIWYKYGAIGKVVLDGSEDEGWTFYNINANRTATFITLSDIKVYLELEAYLPPKVLSNYFNAASQNATWLAGNVSMRYQDSGRVYFCFDTSYTDITSIKEWISTHNIGLYYVLNTPTTTEITDTTLIEQLDNLEKAYSYDTQTNISQTNQDKPFIISYEAILSLKNVLNS